MQAFTYEAISKSGDTRTGVIEADSLRAARAQLRAQSLVPVEVEPVASLAGSAGARRRGKVFNQTGLAVWTRQLAGLVSSGLQLDRALTSLSEEAERPEERALVATLRSEVNGGTPFAKALTQYPKEFSDVYVAVIAAGEESGDLGKVLSRLADDLEAQHALRSKLVGAALYPAIVSLVAVVIVVFLITYVVPQIASVFTSSKRALPFLTVLMIGVSEFVRSYGWVLLVGVAGAVVGARFALANPVFRERFDARWLSLPIVGRMARSYNAARFAGTLAMLTSGGVPILTALQAATATMSNHAMRADGQDVLNMVGKGATLASSIGQKKRFPGLVAMFCRLGEDTAQLPEMLDRAAVQLSTEVQRRAMQFATMLEPLLIVAMGGLVMLIVLAVLLPIIQLNQLVG